MRLGLSLLLANYLAFAVFLAFRPSEPEYLRVRDEGWQRGEFMFNSAEPTLFIAGRPLYQWNHWHGGERLPVKILEVANLPALVAAGVLAPFVAIASGASLFSGTSSARGLLFLLFASAQWLVMGRWISRRWAASRHRIATAGEPSQQ